MGATPKLAPEQAVLSMMTKYDRPPGEQTKRQFLDGLRDVLNGLRSDPIHGDAIRRFEALLNLIRKEEDSSYMGENPLLAARDLLSRSGKWTLVQTLALELSQKDVEAPSTRNAKTTAGSRRPLTNTERLIRLMMQGVNHGKLLGYKTVEANQKVTYVGLVGWTYPKGVTPIMPAESTKGRKKK